MREILFRGRMQGAPEWVYGCYYKQSEFYGDTMEDHIIITSCEDLSYDQALQFESVEPKTVGQFTGLTDKNGKKVFEGDILKFTDVKYDYEWIGRVEFGNPNAEYNWGFQLVYIKGEKPNTDILCWFDMEETGAFAEVIGNIHDNPELLEG